MSLFSLFSCDGNFKSLSLSFLTEGAEQITEGRATESLFDWQGGGEDVVYSETWEVQGEGRGWRVM